MKTRYILPLMLLAALVSCKKDDSPAESALSGSPMTLTGGIGDTSTKINFVEEQELFTSVTWQENDRLWVRASSQPYWERGDCFTTSADKISADGRTATFSGIARTDGKLCAIYPFQYVNEASNNDKIMLDVIQSKSLVRDNCAFIANCAAAFWADGSDAFTMQYLFGALKVSLVGAGQVLAKAELIDNNGENALWGTCTIVPDYAKKTFKSVKMTNSSGSKNTIALTSSDGITLDSTPLEFYFIAPAGSLSDGFMLKLTAKDGSIIKLLHTTSTANKIVRGTVIKLPTMDVSIPDTGDFSGGTGTEEDPYLITSPEDLIELSLKVNTAGDNAYASKYYRQAGTINMSGKSFTPIGNTQDTPFKGHYNGGGNSITNLSTAGTDSSNPASGVFGYAIDAEISNVVIRKRTNTGDFNRVGGLVGFAQRCTISECQYVEGELTASQNICGGLVGQLSGGTISHCDISGAKVTSTGPYVGGIVGWCTGNGTIKNCNVLDSSTIKGTNGVGGICGRLDYGTIKTCKCKGTSWVEGSGYGVGGVCGWSIAENPCVIDNCYMQEKSRAKGQYSISGILGYAYPNASKSITLINCGVGSGYIHSTTCDTGGDVSKGDCMNGGICGWLRASNANVTAKVINCFAYVSGGGFPIDTEVAHPSIGDIVGYVSTSGTCNIQIANCCGNLYLSDIVRAGTALTISDSSTYDSYRVGAIFGYISGNNSGCSVKHCYFVNDKDLKIGSTPGSSVVLSGNVGVALSTFNDQTTVKNALNSYVSSYSGSETLMTWTIYSSRPYI
ncbi:MAG: hypothetical protein IJS66_00435 [Bacteroidales bacterium]|nr:hypothetical protein [Bacteroidales bacterium]